MKSKTIESAYEGFLDAEVSLDTFLSLEITKIDNDIFAALQKSAWSTPQGIEQLVLFSEHLSSPMLRERLIANMYSHAKNYEKAIEWAVKAMEVAPRWDMETCVNIFNTLAWNLYLAGRYEEAKKWGEIGLAYNPFFPYLVGTLCEVYFALGKHDKAESFYKWLKQSGYSGAWGEYKSNPAYQDVEPYQPSSVNRVKLTDADLYKVLVSQEHFSNRPVEVKQVNLAVSLLAAGRVASAMAVSQMITVEGIMRIQGRVIGRHCQGLLPEEQVKEIAAGKGIYALKPDNRVKAIKKCRKNGEVDALWHLVFDPDYDVSMYACEALLEMEVRGELKFYLDLAKEWEYKTGKSIVHSGAPKPYDLADVAGKAVIKLRGVPLIEKIIEDIQNGTSDISIAIPQPVAKDILDTLTMPGSLPLSPSLRRFLEFDGSWLARSTDLYTHSSQPDFEAITVARAVKENLDPDYFWQCFTYLPEPLPQAKCMPLVTGCETMRVLFLAKPDAFGEYPILDLDIDDTPTIYLDACGLDVWLARESGLIEDPEIEYQNDMRACRRRLFGKHDELWCDSYGEDELDADGNSEPAEEEPVRRQPPLQKATTVKPEVLAAMPAEKLTDAFIEALDGDNEALATQVLDELVGRFPEDDTWKRMALNSAVWDGETDFVRRLIELGADPNLQNSTYGPMVVMASSWRDFELLKVLVEAGADLNVPDKRGQTALGGACENKRVDVVKYYLEHGANPASSDMPLKRACNFFYDNIPNIIDKTIETCEMLIAAGADVNQGFKTGQTALLEAIRFDRSRVVEYLLSQGADVNLLDWHGDNALQSAWRENKMDCFEVLLKTNAHHDLRNEDGWCLADVYQDETCQLPKVLNVRLYETDKEQKINFRLKALLKNKYAARIDIMYGSPLLVKMEEYGLIGSDLFAPHFSQVYWEDDASRAERNEDKKANNEPQAVDEVIGTYTVRGIAASAFSNWLLTFFNSLAVTMELEIVAEPIAGERIAIDTEQAIQWIRSRKPEPIKTWHEIPFPVTEASAPHRICTITFTRQAERDEEGYPLFELANLVADIVRQFEIEELPGEFGKERVWFNSQTGGQRATLNFAYLGGSKTSHYNCDVEVTRALVMNALTKLHHTGLGIESVEWSLGVTGDPSEFTQERLLQEEFGGDDKIEVSPSGRATCRACGQKIAKGVVRFAFNVGFDALHYYHLKCAAERHGDRLKDAMARYDGEIPEKEDLIALIGKPGRPPKTVDTHVFPYAELAKTGRSSCMKCGEKIDKNTWRVAVEREFEGPTGSMMSGPGYLHPACAGDWEGMSLEAVLQNTPDLDDESKKTLTDAFMGKKD
ncbi:MAG: ankyrin repeat domain-containing protein [Anaerolineae bacterium]|nr:ankyrin repeat domain-containing protein [Anaerolineae bacterium]